jgi:hypothetical protein
MIRRAFYVLVLALFTTCAAGQDIRLTPVDEGSSDPTWPRFKSRLLAALEQRDQRYVLSIVDRGIRNYSGTDGVAEFRKLWEPQSSGSLLWVELRKLLFLGGVFVKSEKGNSEFCLPYVYYRWPDKDTLDEAAAVIAKETLMKAAPSANAGTLQTLSYDLVAVIDWEVDDADKTSAQKWVKLKTRKGEGYVPEEHIRSPLEYRACFAKNGAGWRMTALEVGE